MPGNRDILPFDHTCTFKHWKAPSSTIHNSDAFYGAVFPIYGRPIQFLSKASQAYRSKKWFPFFIHKYWCVLYYTFSVCHVRQQGSAQLQQF